MPGANRHAALIAASPFFQAAGPAAMAELLAARFTQLLPLARAMNALLSRHWRLMVVQVVDLKLRGAEQRVAGFIARRAAEDGVTDRVALPEPRTAIAARLGMTPETLSRALATLEEKGHLRREPDGATISDRAARDG